MFVSQPYREKNKTEPGLEPWQLRLQSRNCRTSVLILSHDFPKLVLVRTEHRTGCRTGRELSTLTPPNNGPAIQT